ncbi:hypothetical protein ADIMK_4031 [Marinobacterium lacunae]|uniref:tRNA 5-methylaminomethyl-2-thiouridine synthase TusB n=2 Tax=Marinobacterium lacunae TaxID=1232683 RepID=A0A081FTM9_9GAMM|nr:hypothetical protein ADIMK_4031 [Marinobacterium lacunae]
MDEQDSLLLIEDGVYWALPAYSDQLASIPGRVFALEADIRSRGVGNSTLECIDDSGFVQLCVSHHKVVSWF